MVIKETLDTLPDLVDSGFGRPYPRHGLNLLYWFVTQCLQFSNNQITVDEDCDPSKGDYGFKPFDNEEKILPDTNLPYYEVGNLNPRERRGLPKYVWRGYTGNWDDSNTDRIIICINGSSLESLYVTRHKGQWKFNPNQTFCISPELLQTISDMKRKDFLRQATSRYITIPESTRETPQTIIPERRPRQTPTVQDYQLPPISAEKYCGMCCSCLFILFIIAVFVFILYSYLFK